MSTAQQIVSDALQEIGVLGAGQTADAEDADVGLRRLNGILETWSNSRLMFPVLAEVSVPMTGAGSYTIGPSGADVTAARPIKVTHATYIDTGGIESPIVILGQNEWDAIGLKAVDGGYPGWIWYQAANTTGILNVYPKANTGTLKLDCLSLLTSFPTLGTSVTLPPGYERALSLSLALALCPSFTRKASRELMLQQAGAVRVLKRTNYEPVMLTEPGRVASGVEMIQRGF